MPEPETSDGVIKTNSAESLLRDDARKIVHDDRAWRGDRINVEAMTNLITQFAMAAYVSGNSDATAAFEADRQALQAEVERLQRERDIAQAASDYYRVELGGYACECIVDSDHPAFNHRQHKPDCQYVRMVRLMEPELFEELREPDAHPDRTGGDSDA